MSRKILVEIAVPDNWESRLDMQPWIESEIRADRWLWRWATEASVSELPDNIKQILTEFGEYAHSVRMNWSDFDGRSLLRYWQEIDDRLRAAVLAAIDEAYQRGRQSTSNPSLDEALNSGDGVYRL